MIGAVGHDDGVVRADCEASRPGKASGFAPPHPELKQLPPLQQVMTPPTIAGIDRSGGGRAVNKAHYADSQSSRDHKSPRPLPSPSLPPSPDRRFLFHVVNHAITCQGLRDKCSNSLSAVLIEASYCHREKFTRRERQTRYIGCSVHPRFLKELYFRKIHFSGGTRCFTPEEAAVDLWELLPRRESGCGATDNEDKVFCDCDTLALDASNVRLYLRSIASEVYLESCKFF